VHGVVLEHVRHVVGGDEGVVDGDDLDVVARHARAHHQAPDAPEAVDADLNLGRVGGGREHHRVLERLRLDGGGGGAHSPGEGEIMQCGGKGGGGKGGGVSEPRAQRRYTASHQHTDGDVSRSDLGTLRRTNPKCSALKNYFFRGKARVDQTRLQARLRAR